MKMPSKIRNQTGATLISAALAAGIVVCGIAGTIASSLYLANAMRKTEATNLAVILEANLISSFNNKTNYPDSVNPNLRSGSATSLALTTSFGTINLDIQTGIGNSTGTIGYFKKDLSPCSGFTNDKSCIIRYEVRLKRTGNAGVNSYSFSYQIDTNPDVVDMAPLGSVTNFDTPIDPGNIRAEQTLTKCDPVNDLFMMGANRDTGESFCVEKPSAANSACPPGKIPKGLNFVQYLNQKKSGTIQLDCTAASMRTFTCPSNYSLQKFDPRYSDPEFSGYSNPFGTCVFRTANQATLPGAFPANATSTYMRTITGTFCPPYYKAGNNGCNLVEDLSRRNNIAYGKGKCAATCQYDCHRSTWTDSVVTNPAYTAWVACGAATPTPLVPGPGNDPTKPPYNCGTAPASTVISRTCSTTETSTTCNGVADSASTCSTKGSWDSGTSYACAPFVDTYPTATANGSGSGRNFTCGFTDTSASCGAPATLYGGATWGKKNPKWYGGVQVSGVTCTFDPSQGAAETVNAL